MIKRYLIDANILSVLLKTKNSEVIEKNYNDLLTGLETVINGTIDEYLVKNGVSTKYDTIKELTSDKVDPKTNELLESSELKTLIDSNTQLYFKAFLDVYWKKISPEEQKDIETYLNDYDDLYKEKFKLILENIDAINDLDDQMKNAVLSDMRSNNVNLGGNLSQPVNVTAPVATAPTPAPTPVPTPAAPVNPPNIGAI